MPEEDPVMAHGIQEALDIATRNRQSSKRGWVRSTFGTHGAKTAGARDLVAPVYGWFTEGFDPADLMEAKALLEELS